MVTIGFEQTSASIPVAENVGNVTIHVIIISGTLERELSMDIIPEPGSALGKVLYIYVRRHDMSTYNKAQFQVQAVVILAQCILLYSTIEYAIRILLSLYS